MSEGTRPSVREGARLARQIGLGGALLLSFNGVVGSGIFALPASLAERLGAFSPYIFPIASLLILVIAIPYARAAGAFEHNGGPAAHGAAFGRLRGVRAGLDLLHLPRRRLCRQFHGPRILCRAVVGAARRRRASRSSNRGDGRRADRDQHRRGAPLDAPARRPHLAQNRAADRARHRRAGAELESPPPARRRHSPS